MASSCLTGGMIWLARALQLFYSLSCLGDGGGSKDMSLQKSTQPNQLPEPIVVGAAVSSQTESPPPFRWSNKAAKIGLRDLPVRISTGRRIVYGLHH